MNELLIYGAVTPPRTVLKHPSTTLKVKELMDRARYKMGLIGQIDYRNHVTANSFNRGDLAIAMGAQQVTKKVEPRLTVTFADWGELESAISVKNVLVGGSGYFFLDSNGRLPQRIRRDLQYLHDQQKPYAFFGVGINSVRESLNASSTTEIAPEDAEPVERLLKAARFVSVRDQQTLNALQPYADRPIFLSGDPALYLRPNSALQVARPQTRRMRIGINIPFHGPAANDRVRQDLGQYIDCFRQLQQSTGAELVQLVHFDTERLIGRLIQDAGVPLSIVNGSVDELQHTYASLDLHVGGMLHSCILACSVGTPCVGLAYDVKHFGFFDLMQMPDYCVPSRPFNADAVLAQCHHALAQGQALRDHIDGRREQLRAATEAYLRDVLPRWMDAP